MLDIILVPCPYSRSSCVWMRTWLLKTHNSLGDSSVLLKMSSDIVRIHWTRTLTLALALMLQVRLGIFRANNWEVSNLASTSLIQPLTQTYWSSHTIEVDLKLPVLQQLLNWLYLCDFWHFRFSPGVGICSVQWILDCVVLVLRIVGEGCWVLHPHTSEYIVWLGTAMWVRNFKHCKNWIISISDTVHLHPITRMHSSRMRTVRCSELSGGGVMPPGGAMHAPSACMGYTPSPRMPPPPEHHITDPFPVPNITPVADSKHGNGICSLTAPFRVMC